ncbi:hypothetical protein T440DRAFT_447550 [Plenodomus tracheiphilus IPT5]|uniref:Uncharacterized protein n=1 Tax=Plenodomus tracheiphilus IPT5 TaxID=1408161 RepID=A0A6A7B9J8_9PLEO|nr:hypothetical protein T440DRAFT_447550 [Plenodomus tracheiphilus IPT5]
MVPPSKRAAGAAPLSTTAIAAIVTGIGVVMLCLLSALIFLLVRAVRAHKRLIADLDERGVSIAQAHKEVGRDSVARPRAVLRRNTVLPFNKTSGWGTLPSTETFRSVDSGGVPAHYVPPMPTNAMKRSSHLSWPFSTRRMSGQSMQMKKMKVSRLSTVMESPKSSPLLLNTSHMNASGQSIAMSSEYANSSCQSLLQHHPAFRHQHQAIGPPGAATRGPIDAKKRLHRAQSVVEVSTNQMTRPYLKARSVSLCSQTSGVVPDVILPPLPLEVSRIKSMSKDYSQLHRAPSKLSISSFGSADSAILANRNSPVVPPPAKFRGQKITKPNTKGSSFAGGKNIRDTLDLRAKVLGGRCANDANIAAKASIETQQLQSDHRSTLMEELNIQLPGSVEPKKSNSMSSMPAPSTDSPQKRNSVTPKRRSKTQVSSAGSPERQDQNPTNSRMVVGMRSPKRQHSQTSSRSSGGNPFQWDPTPILPASAKPSNLKGSPSARKGHGRKNSVRISLVPTIHGPPSRVNSLSLHNGHQDGSTGGGAAENINGLGLDLESKRALPTPPTSSTFSPDLKFTATSIKAALTTTSATLPLVGYDQSFVVFPTDQILPPLSATEQKRLSNGSMFSLSRFPATPSIIEPVDYDVSGQYGPPSYNNHDFSGNWMPDTPLIQQYPFGMHTPERNRSPSSPTSMIDIDEYNPEQPNCIYETPPNPNANSRTYQSAFATIPEESSICSNKTVDTEQSRNGNSPPISPKTMSPPRFNAQDRSAYNLPVYATCIPEELSDTIDPSIISKDAFGEYSTMDDSIFGTHAVNKRISIVIPATSQSAQSMLEPLLDAAFPSNESPTIGHDCSELSLSCYSSRSPSPSPGASPIELPSPVYPCSPRPAHAQLPGSQTQGLSINFAEVPKLQPSPRGPRHSPPRPLRSSIAQLRRMNSDALEAKDEKAGRGERRYLRLGREDSMHVPGDESWLDELDDSSAVELDEEEGRRLVGDLLEEHENEWDEGCTVLDLEATDDQTIDSISTIRPDLSTNMNLSALQDHTDADTTFGAPSSTRSSSIWEDGEKFWTSSTPPPPCTASPSSSPIIPSNSTPSRPRNRNQTYQPLASSPLATPDLSTPKSTTTHRKRHFEVAKDDIPNQRGLEHQDLSANDEGNPSPTSSRKKKRDAARRNGIVGGAGRYRKRVVLGVGTANSANLSSATGVRIQVTSPGGHVVVAGGNGMGTPGSLYDSQGFLRL